MAINFTYTTSLGGTPIQYPIKLGSLSNSGGQSTMPLYITHSSTSALHNVGFFIQPYSGDGYVGTYGEMSDYLTVLSWGQTTNKGFIINMDRIATSTAHNYQFRSGSSPQGDIAERAINLQATSLFIPTGGQASTGVGHFPPSATCHITTFLSVASTDVTKGTRQFTLMVKFDV